MMRSRLRIAAVAATVLALSAALALAQMAPGGQQKGAGEQQKARGGRTMVMHTGPMPPAGLWSLLSDKDVNAKVAEEADGVTLLLTSDKPETVKKIQDGLQTYLERKAKIPVPEAAEGQKRPRWLGPFADPNVKAEVANTENGATLTLSSTDEEAAGRIKAVVPKLVEAVKARREAARQMMRSQHEHMMQMGQCMRLIASPEVKIERAETENGVTITISSDNPELAAQIKKLTAAQMERIEKLRQNPEQLEKMGQMMRRMHAGQQMGPMQQGHMQQQMRTRQAGPMQNRDDAQMRRMVRQEVRRALKEMEDDEEQEEPLP